MDTELLKFFRHFAERKNIKFNKKISIFLFFLFIAAVFWFVNALGKDYTTTITCPVYFRNLPKDKVLTGDLPTSLTLKVSGGGFVLFKMMLGSGIAPVGIDIKSSKSLGKTMSRQQNFLITKSLIGALENHFADNLKITDVLPDTVYFVFTTNVEKKVPVKPYFSLSFAKQYMLAGKIMFSPGSVTLSGPRNIIDTVTGVFSDFRFFANISKTIKGKVGLRKLNNVEFSDKSVNVEIPVDRYTEESFDLPVEVINRPQNVTLKIFPAKVRLSFNVCLGDYDKIKPYDFKAIVDYNSLETNISNKMEVEIVKNPTNVSSISFYPKSVEYIIEK